MSTRKPLWSERNGAKLELTSSGFSALAKTAIEKAGNEGLFNWAFHMDETGAYYEEREAEEFFALHLGDPWPGQVLRSPSFVSFRSSTEVLDFFELSARELVSVGGESDGDRAKGRVRWAEMINPLLGRLDPPLEMNSEGTIIASVDPPLRRLVEQPLPESTPKAEVSDRVDDAISHYRRRDATLGDRRAAVRELVDVMEFLRPAVKESMLTADERDLFAVANNFTIRHNKPETKRDWEDPAWLAWMFYMYLATIRLVLELQNRTTTKT